MSKVSEYLYKLQPTRIDMILQGSTPEEEQIVTDHFNYLKTLTEDGVVILFGRTLNMDENTFGIVIFRAESEESARNIMLNDPAVKGNVMCAELYPYRIALMGNYERNQPDLGAK